MSPARCRASFLFVALVAAFTAGSLPLPAAAQEPGADEDTVLRISYVDGLRRARDSLMSASDFEAALEPAQIVIRELQEADEDATADRVMLAIILAELERFDDAEIEFLDLVEVLQDEEGLWSETLITPLHLLGRSYIRARRFPEAVTVLTQARDVSRRSEGLFNVETQIGVIDDLTNAQLGLGDTVAARELQLERLETAQRQFGVEDPQVIPYHYHLADYYENSRLRQSAREQYEAALEIAELSGDTAQILTALSNVVRQDLQLGISLRSRIETLQELVTTTQGGGDEAALGIAHAVLGDAALVEEDAERAAAHYAQAWQNLDAAAGADPAVYFQNPVAIRFIPPLTGVDVGARSLPWAWGTIVLEFDVSANGRVEEVTNVQSEPAELIDEAYVERLDAAWFRPALVAAEPTEARGVVLTHYFRFYVDPDSLED